MADEIVVADPDSGEVLEKLETLPPATLADVLYRVRRQHSTLRKMERLLEEELLTRVELRERALVVFDRYEVSAKAKNESEWDVVELEATLQELRERGVIQAREVTEVIRHEWSVNRREAQRLLTRLSGDAKRAVERCFHWRQIGPTHVQVTLANTPQLPTSEIQEIER